MAFIVLGILTAVIVALYAMQVAGQLPVTEHLPDMALEVVGAAIGVALFFFVPVAYALLIIGVGFLALVLLRKRTVT